MSERDDLNQNPFLILNSIFGVSGRVEPLLYFVVGCVLMLFKYAVEATVVFFTTKAFLTPLAFCLPLYSPRSQMYEAGPDWLPWFVIVWSIPFIWIAFTMSVRRALDAGLSPWVGIWVLVPFANLIAMPLLAILPSHKQIVVPESGVDDAVGKSFDRLVDGKPVDSDSTPLYAAALGLLVGGLFALGTTVLSAYSLHNYGSSLFLGMPVVSGAVGSFVFNQPRIQNSWASFGVGVLTVVFGGLGLLLFAFEGVICLVMATPLIVPMGGLGGLLGWALAKTILVQSKMMLGGAIFVVPFLCLVEQQFKTYQETAVESSVIINASPDEVWNNVVAFPDIDTPPAWYFRMGVASPLRARIIGEGVGAVRHCEFTTGSFVEPITMWDQPNRLAFDVTEQPDPLIELTPYRNVRPPHLQHSFRSVKGEFELNDLGDGRTKLIGRTWYTLDMGPRIYWKVWTEEIIHRIHMRVLLHIKKTCETPVSIPPKN